MPTNHQKGVELAREAVLMLDYAEQQGREPTRRERLVVEAMLEAAEQYKSMPDTEEWQRPRVPSLGFDAGLALGAPGRLDRRGNVVFSGFNPGARFTESAEFKALQSGALRETGLIAITDTPPRLEFKGTLSEGLTGAYGAGFVSVPQVVPGLVEKLFQPLSIERALSSGVADGPTIRYVTEGTAVSGAAGVAEGGLKPESTLGVQTADEVVKKIATITVLTEEMIQDSPSVQSYVNGRLLLFVNQEAERQLLRGSTVNEVSGILNRGVPIYPSAGVAGTAMAESLFKGFNQMRGSALIEPDWAILAWQDYETIRLARDANGQLYGGGPFAGGPYGNGAQAAASGQLSGATDVLWNKAIYVTNALGKGTALIGSRDAAAVWNRGGVSVAMSASGQTPSGDDAWRTDQYMVRAERRLALTMYRKTGFLEVRFG